MPLLNANAATLSLLQHKLGEQYERGLSFGSPLLGIA
jgi:hypothetical protein